MITIMCLQLNSCGCCGICGPWRPKDPARRAVTWAFSTSPVDRCWGLGNWPRNAEVQLLCWSLWIWHWTICHPTSERILVGSPSSQGGCLSSVYWVLGGCIQLQAGKKWEHFDYFDTVNNSVWQWFPTFFVLCTPWAFLSYHEYPLTHECWWFSKSGHMELIIKWKSFNFISLIWAFNYSAFSFLFFSFLFNSN